MLVMMATGVAHAAKPPKDAPFCPEPGTRPVFVAPMGEVFRAAAGQPYPVAAWFAAVDGDADGRISRAEMMADATRFFKRLDKDADGRLTPDEVARYEGEIAPEIALYAGRDAPVPKRRGGLFAAAGGAAYAGPIGAGRFAWLNIPEPVAAADADLDRVVTLREFTEAAGRRFDTLAGGAAALSPGALPRTPQQAALEGPCRPPPRKRSGDRNSTGQAGDVDA